MVKVFGEPEQTEDVIVSSQPPLRSPTSPPRSSIIYSDQVPLGAVPLNIESAEPPSGAGAGALNTSPAPMLVGLKVPVVKIVASGMLVAAASSSVNVIALISGPPPTSDIMIAFCPPGPTRSISISSGKVWVRPLSFTVTEVIVPVKPDTAMLEG